MQRVLAFASLCRQAAPGHIAVIEVEVASRDPVKPVLDLYRSCLTRSWRAKVVGLFKTASTATISTSDCKA